MARSSTRVKPPLRSNLMGDNQNFATFLLDVHVFRLAPVAGVKEESVRPEAKNGRHCYLP